MDSDFSSPAALYFKDDSFVVREAPDRHDEAILWLSFSEVWGDLNFSVYDPKEGEYTHQFSGNSATDVNVFLAGVEQDYNVTIPNSFRTPVHTFLALKNESFGVHVNLMGQDEDSYCEQCGDYGSDQIEAFYFPAIPAVGPASVGLYWRQGCYTSYQVAGGVDDPEVVEKMLDLLERAATSAPSRSEKREIKGFRNDLKAVLSLGKGTTNE